MHLPSLKSREVIMALKRAGFVEMEAIGQPFNFSE